MEKKIRKLEKELADYEFPYDALEKDANGVITAIKKVKDLKKQVKKMEDEKKKLEEEIENLRQKWKIVKSRLNKIINETICYKRKISMFLQGMMNKRVRSRNSKTLLKLSDSIHFENGHQKTQEEESARLNAEAAAKAKKAE
ncbi:hypothetical protein GCK72_022610 [Caenorhabditis remanei]|uniref:Uncharacterized protein n=1 Tax=Caenorhabditis remanei TaxID=31234 RepID=A0A6A5FU96_CAERE|nr:hypothetical protein GCK72_022610 [Caenorhabditis remanei]KAF1746157.1 hypothetical protein GCK72_022610 [Caenorhabditis remanei]